MPVQVVAVERPDLKPMKMPDRFRHEIAYFMALPGQPGVGEIAPGEYWVRKEDAQTWLEDGVIRIVSPLDSANQTELGLSEEQEAWLEWIVREGVERIRLV